MTISTDIQQRQEALDPTQSFIVQAPAGSGKTALLVKRFLVLLAQANHPEEIIAITFTRKAAAEMRERIINALAENLPPEKIAQWQLIKNPHRLRIQTIDALCSNLIRQMPILSGFGAHAEISEDPSLLYLLAAREVLAELEHDTPQSAKLADLLLHLDNDHNKAEKLLSAMLARRDQWLPHVVKQHNMPRQILEHSLQRANQDALTRLEASLPKSIAAELFELLHFAAGNNPLCPPCQGEKHPPLSPLSGGKQGSPLAEGGQGGVKENWPWIANILLTQEGTWRKKISKNEGFPAPSTAKTAAEKNLFSTMKNRMEQLLAQLIAYEDFRFNLHEVRLLPPDHYTDTQWHILNVLIELLPILAAHLQVIFQERGVVDYIEVASRALQALGDTDTPTDLALALDYRIQHILVDEFQDTSIAQLRLLEHLTAGWQPNDGRTLFLVGDPMQSIYRFRKAEVGLFLRTCLQGLGTVQLKPLVLNANFRSTVTIVDWINAVFSTLLPKQADISVGAVPFSPSLAQRSTEKESAITLHALTDQSEAKTITQLITDIHATQPQASIAILVRSRTHLLDILPNLSAANIHYRAIEIESLYDRPVIQDLLALTRALISPADRIAWLAILRAPWCGLTLADLHILANSPKQTLWENLQTSDQLSLSATGHHHVQRIIPILTEALKHRRRQSLAHWIEGVWQALGGPACLTTALELNDATAYFKLLNTAQIDGTIINIFQFENQLSKLYASTDAHVDNAVDVMTIHKAKGLEFDIVILPGLERALAADDPQLLLYLERATLQGDTDLLLAPIKATTDERDAIYEYLRNEEKKRADHETIRLLYVAITRAKQALHLFATLTADKKPVNNSLLAKLWPALANDFTANMTKNNSNTIEIDSNIAPSVSLKRLTTSWQLPATPTGFLPQFTHDPSKEGHNEQFTHWSNDPARAVGTVIHRLLQQICLDGLAQWNVETINARKSHIHSMLDQLGVSTHHLEKSVTQVEQALQQTLADPRGRWILATEHPMAAAEYPLTAILGHKTVSIIIDRTFIDDKGIRWIIDYKTGTPEVEPYRQQLEQYAYLMRMQDSRPIHLGLYFPLTSTWYEWEYNS